MGFPAEGLTFYIYVRFLPLMTILLMSGLLTWKLGALLSRYNSVGR